MSDIKELINKFLDGIKPDERDASFDYCYNYFYSFYKRNKLAELANEENIQMSCLQLGFYLASWGMMRNSFIQKKSVKNFRELIIAISEMNPKWWEIDVDNYDEENIQQLLKCQEKIIETLIKENNPSDTLVTKIMLGVFANVPAYDTYFLNFLRKNKYCQAFNQTSLEQIKEFYDKNKE